MIGWDRLSFIDTVPAASPIDLAAAKLHCKVDFSDDDTLISVLIEAARSYIDGPRGIGICMVPQKWRMTLDQFYTRFELPFGNIIEIPLGPVASVDAVKYIDGTGTLVTISPANYFVDSAREIPRLALTYGNSWPVPRTQPGAVTIDFTAGFGTFAVPTVPGALKVAMLHLISHWYDNRGLISEGHAVPEIPFTVDALLGKYRVGSVA